MRKYLTTAGFNPDDFLYQLYLNGYEDKTSLKYSETNSEYVYTTDLVGLDKSKLSFKIEGLKATLEYNNPDDKRRSKFIYSFTLPEIADIDKVTTSYEDGELKIVVGKLNRKIKEYAFN